MNRTDVPTVWEGAVAVYGGGPAGLAAATAAARCGADVLLIEKNGYLGGVATAAGVTVFHSLFSPDFEVKVIGGLTEEFLDRLMQMDAVYNLREDGRGNFVVETEYAKFVADELVLGAGARMLLHTFLVDAAREGDRITEALVANKSGLGRIRAKVHVDATGDGDLYARAGLDFEKRTGQLQSPSLCVRLADVDHAAAEAAGFSTSGINDLLRTRAAEAGWTYSNFLWGTDCKRRPLERFYSAVRVDNVDATDAGQLSDAEVEGRRQLRWMADLLRAEVPGYEKATIVDIGAQLGLRETRRLLGRHVLTADELLSQQRFDDAIAQGSYPVDIHAADGVGIAFRYLDGRESRFDADGQWHRGYWTPDGKPRPAVCYQIPYRCLVSDRCANLLAAGRPISVDAAAGGATRVMVNCMQTGEAAGVAAAIAAASGAPDVRTVDVAAVQRTLVAAGMPLRGEGA